MSEIEYLLTSDIAVPAGHYSQGVSWGELIFVSGQLPVLADGSHGLAGASFGEQARQAYANLLGVLRAGGADLEDVLKVAIYISDVADWPECNRLHAELFGPFRPARTVIPTGLLHHGYRIELDAIARRPSAG